MTESSRYDVIIVGSGAGGSTLAGLHLWAFIAFEAPLSGMSLNPARSAASAFVAGDFTHLCDVIGAHRRGRDLYGTDGTTAVGTPAGIGPSVSNRGVSTDPPRRHAWANAGRSTDSGGSISSV